MASAGQQGRVGQVATTGGGATSGSGIPGNSAASSAANSPTPPAPRRLALFGLPPAVAETVTLLAEILGWQVLHFPPGPAMRPPARACLAMLPQCAASTAPPLALWSPEKNLNEHISQAGLSILDQPLCITRVEQMLEALDCEP